MRTIKLALTCLILTFFTTVSLAQSLAGKNALELKKMQTEAVANENYDLAEKIKKQLLRIEANKTKIAKLEEEKKDAILIEDYDKAEALENQIEALKSGNTAINEEPIKKAVEPVVAPKPTPVAEVASPDAPLAVEMPVTLDEFNFFKHGFYLDAMAGLMTATKQDANIGVGVRIGNKWYFGKNESFRSGFQVRWVKVGLFPLNDLVAHFAPLNVGYTGISKLSSTTALELNFTVGFNMVMGFKQDYTYFTTQSTYEYDPLLGYSTYKDSQIQRTDSDDVLYMGILFNPSVKYRYKTFAVGLDIAFSNMWGEDIELDLFEENQQSSPPNINVIIISATAGFKF